MLELMLNDKVLELEATAPDLMLLDYLRNQRGMTGTKEGCASGDCGACTVVIAGLDSNAQLSYQQINACITPLNALHGKQIITIEHLKKGDRLDPVQDIITQVHGSQCGFCTPGVVMSLFALSKQNTVVDRPEQYLIGNLCRCTGYGPLIEAARQVAALPQTKESEEEKKVRQWMRACQRQDTPDYLKPLNREALAAARKALPHARLIAGGTDIALEITQELKTIRQFIDISAVDDLLNISQTENGCRIGAAIPLAQLHPFMAKHFPGTDELFSRIGSLSIRNRATLGGSLSHASPIGDIAPLLISLNGKIEVDNGTNRQLYTPEEYITGYCKTALGKDQWVSAIHLPYLGKGQKHAIYKISKRHDDDISSVVLGINLTLSEDNKVAKCVISAGGVAPKTLQLHQLENLTINQFFTQSLIDKVKNQVPNAIHPISDLRASAEYRILLVQNLIQRFYLECNQIPARLTDDA